MRRSPVIFLALLLLPFFAHAYYALIWNYDAVDKFYDSQVGDSVDCTYWLEQSLDANGHTFQTRTSLPGNLDSYDVVVVTLGGFRC